MARKTNTVTKNSYEKYQLRGAIKEIMRNYGLRTISLANYNRYLGNDTNNGIHSVKYDIMNGYIHLHDYKENGKCGSAQENVDVETYANVYNTVLNILKNEDMPNKVKRNILVKVNR